MKKLNIAFVWHWKQAPEVFPNWRDGLRGAIEIIGKKHKVHWSLGEKLPKGNKYDFILFWDDSNSEFFKHSPRYSARKGICLTTHPHNIQNLLNIDVVFVESEPIYKACRMHGLRTIRAFGTDTDFYKPIVMKKDIEYFYPATFSPWKRQSEIAHLGKKLLCVGTKQPDGDKEYLACKKKGVRIELGYFPAQKIRNYYNRAKKVIIPAVHGSERTVLEAMSMNILPEFPHDTNMRAMSYVEEYKGSGYDSPREFVVKNYSHYKYAEDLLRGIEQ